MPNKTLRCGTARLCVALLLMSGSVAGCERVVSVTLPTSAPRLVVEARLERIRGKVSGNQEIRLSATDDYFSRSAPPAVTNATVRVADSTGRVYAFIPSPSTPGSYVASGLTIVTGARYTLRITWQGDEYEATERAMAGPDGLSPYCSTTLAPMVGFERSTEVAAPGVRGRARPIG